MKRTPEIGAVYIILASFLFLCGLSFAQNPTTSTVAIRPSVEKLASVVQSKAAPVQERLQALHTLYAAKNALSRQERVGLLQSAKTIARDKQEDARLRADAVWAFGGMGMLLKHEKTWTQEDVSRECQFLLKAAADEAEDTQVRRLSVAAMGDLKMKEAVPVVKALLANKENINRSEIARSASIALVELAPDEALEPVGKILSKTSDPSVFGSAAYALGRTNSQQAIPLLVRNRLRLGDNLSVDNAIEATSGTLVMILKTPTDPLIVPAIQATRSLWREEQKAEYTPLLRALLADTTLPLETRREALTRLMEDADLLTLGARKERLSDFLPLVDGEDAFATETARMRSILKAKVLPIIRVEEANKGGLEQ